ncbi:MAG: ribosome small subunit-dependent GTPase A [Chlorobiaceae bacterium]|nr:ribosome small subunit-dependent GTPase A [Chlorobiaceae bacterium]NTV59732.1 ribosome small subunit-dependent GTPase A [Chlorobiaceae bacterium]
MKTSEGDGLLPEGVVTEVAGVSYIVSAEDGSVFRSRTFSGTKTENGDSSLVAVGDRVLLKATESGSDMREAIISKVMLRRSVLERKRDIRRNRSKEKVQVIAANIDLLVVVVSAFEPPLSPRLIDRYLVFAESEQLETLIVVNKMDLEDTGETRDIMNLYDSLDYRVMYTSSMDPDSILPLSDALAGRVSAFSGHSGVGKSTLINMLIGKELLRTGETSMKSGKGVHTTSSAVMEPLPGGGFVIDTPGIREFNLSGITRENLRFYFREFAPCMPDCTYSSCTHTVEPGCGVRRAAENGYIDSSRYESYLVILDSLDDENRFD